MKNQFAATVLLKFRSIHLICLKLAVKLHILIVYSQRWQLPVCLLFRNTRGTTEAQWLQHCRAFVHLQMWISESPQFLLFIIILICIIYTGTVWKKLFMKLLTSCRYVLRLSNFLWSDWKLVWTTMFLLLIQYASDCLFVDLEDTEMAAFKFSELQLQTTTKITTAGLQLRTSIFGKVRKPW